MIVEHGIASLYPYTQEDFDAFREECSRLLRCFGLDASWAVVFAHRDLDGATARVDLDWEARHACFSLALYLKPDTFGAYPAQDVKARALHEVLHLVVHDLVQQAARRADADAVEVNSAEHELIRRFEKFLAVKAIDAPAQID